MSLQSDYPEIFQKLNEIGDACSEAAKITDRKGQQKSKEAIEEQAKQFMVLLNSYKSDGRMDAEIYHVFGQELLDGIYDIVKLASKQNFGIIELTTDLPLDTIAEHQLTRLAERNAVASANLTQKARLNESGKLIFCKNTHPDVAQLEIVAAQFYRHTLDGRTAQGKVIVEAGRIVGMYVEAIPGFVSMRQLTDLAKNPSAYNEVDKKIQELSKDIETINEKIANVVGDSIQLKVQLEEKQNFLGVYTQIKELQLIDVTTGSVNIAKVPGIVAKALCSSFFCEDWDRHKDNFGISFANGKLGVASLDYDKSLSGIFGQDHKCYDWNITPKRLRDFPDFDCWYWPTSSNSFRKFFGSLVAPEKISKMYSESEAKQYSELKNNAEFKRQAQIEWLKVVFIPKELRQLAVSSLASTTCDSRLKNAPGILEEKRQALLNALVQTNSFRETYKENLTMLLDEVKNDLKQNLSIEESLIVEKNWSKTQLDVENNIKRIEGLEKIAEKEHPPLIAAIKKSGISFSSLVTDDLFNNTLKSISVSDSSESIRKRLNKNLGLDISVYDARKIKEEIYIKMLSKSIPGLDEVLKNTNLDIRGKSILSRDRTIKGIKAFKMAVIEYIDADEASSEPLNKAIKCLRDLGINAEVIGNKELESMLQQAKGVRSAVNTKNWQKHVQVKKINEEEPVHRSMTIEL